MNTDYAVQALEDKKNQLQTLLSHGHNLPNRITEYHQQIKSIDSAIEILRGR